MSRAPSRWRWSRRWLHSSSPYHHQPLLHDLHRPRSQRHANTVPRSRATRVQPDRNTTTIHSIFVLPSCLNRCSMPPRHLRHLLRLSPWLPEPHNPEWSWGKWCPGPTGLRLRRVVGAIAQVGWQTTSGRRGGHINGCRGGGWMCRRRR